MSRRSKTVMGVPVPSVQWEKEDDFWRWYRETLEKSEMIDAKPPIPGYFILEPAAYAVWERIHVFLGDRIKRLGVRDFAFPLLAFENTPGDDHGHAEGINPMLRNQLSNALDIYPCYARWITSHRDLPLLLNQWKSKFSREPSPQPFLRCREFLAQEAHTAHLTQSGAHDEIRQVVDLYAAFYEEFLAVPVIRGQRSHLWSRASSPNPDVDEVNTNVVVGYIPALDQCVEGGICRELDQRFSKQYGIAVRDPSFYAGDPAPLIHVWQNFWSLSIRAIGLMVATHGDNQGLVIPPNVAETQVVVIPLKSSRNKQDHQKIHDEINSIIPTLSSLGVRATADLCDWHSPGWKYQEYIIRGVPLRLSLGSEELAGQYANVYRRDLSRPEATTKIPLSKLPTAIPSLLETISRDLFEKASNVLRSRQKQVTDWKEFVDTLHSRETARICLAPHCLTKDCEQRIEDLRIGPASTGTASTDTRSFVKCICIPWNQPGEIQESSKCINPDCGESARKWAMFGYEY